ncbi:MFS transporter [Streptomyces sp. ISL-36]|uniref:MFS transporter n=1 Tax=Streptomyces sp. ISL-36 TaxID=2819182 RepID=UPI001BEAD2F7|nr:MFS transporter [Streptomyces sp. ISL-36]MBT2445193.1 MFS transporter [Streptomyces sp. ISL-36]
MPHTSSQASRAPRAPRAPRALLLAQLSNSIGDGAFYVSSALYFTQIVGLSAPQIGIGLTLAWAVGSVAGVWLGHLADRRGPRGTAVLLALATAAAVGSFLLIRSFVPFLVAATVYATAQSGLAASRQALLAGLVEPAARTEVLARLQSTLNAGLAVGAGLGGLALHTGTRTAYLSVFALDALGFLFCALVLRALPPVAGTPAASGGEPRLVVLRDRPYALLTFLNALLLLRLPLLSLALPLWIVQRTSAPGWVVSALFVLNTGAVMLFQVRTARSVTSLAEATRAVGRSGIVMLASCAVFAVTAAGLGTWITVAVLALGAALQVAAEMRHSAGSWQISFALAPAERIGQYQGFFGTGVPVARTLGPLLVTALLVTWGVPGWLLLGGVFLLAGLATKPAVRWAERSRGRATTEAATTEAATTRAATTEVAVGGAAPTELVAAAG